jgi:hypothetical protein
VFRSIRNGPGIYLSKDEYFLEYWKNDGNLEKENGERETGCLSPFRIVRS